MATKKSIVIAMCRSGVGGDFTRGLLSLALLLKLVAESYLSNNGLNISLSRLISSNASIKLLIAAYLPSSNLKTTMVVFRGHGRLSYLLHIPFFHFPPPA